MQTYNYKGAKYNFPDNISQEKALAFIKSHASQNSPSEISTPQPQERQLFAPSHSYLADAIGTLEKSTLSEMAKGGQSIANFFLPKRMQDTTDMDTAFDSLNLPELPEGAAKEFVKGGGQMLATAPLAVESKIGELASLAKKSPAAAKALKYIADLTAGSVQPALATAFESKDPEDILSSIGLSFLMPPAFQAAAKGLDKLTLSGRLKSALPDEEIMANMKAAEGTNTPLGDIVGDTHQKRKYKNLTAKLSGSKGAEVAQKTYQQVQNKAQDTVKNILDTTDINELNEGLHNKAEDALKTTLKTDDISDANEKLNQQGEDLIKQSFGDVDKNELTEKASEALSQGLQNAQKQSNALYEKAQKTADADENFNIDANKARQALKENKDAIHGVLSSSARKTLKKITGKSTRKTSPMDLLTGKKPIIERPSVGLKEANLLKAELNTEARAALSSPDFRDRKFGGQLAKVAKGLGSDIDSAIENSGNEELKSQWKEAQNNYRENYAPFLEPKIYKHGKGYADSDNIFNDFIKKGSNSDRANLAGKLTKVLGKDANLVPLNYFSSAFDNDGNLINHKKLADLITRLPANLFEKIVPQASARNALMDYAKQSDLNQFLSKFLKGNGDVDAKRMAKEIQKLEDNPKEFEKLVTDKNARKKLVDFKDTHERNKAFEKALEPEGKVNTAKLAAIQRTLAMNEPKYKKLVPNARDREKLSEQETLQRLNPSSDNPNFNPPTGQQLKELTPIIHAKLGAAILANLIGAPAGAVAGLIIPKMRAGFSVDKMTSEKAREKIIKDFLEKRRKPKESQPSAASKAANLIAQVALLASQGGQ